MNTTFEIQVLCDGELETASFTDLPIRIGRDESCDLHLPYAFVSRHHARIERQGDGFVLVDEGSRNGVRYGTKRLPRGGRVELGEQCEIRIEQVVMTVRIDEATRQLGADQVTSLYSDRQMVPEVLARVGGAMEEFHAARAVALAIVGNSLRATPRRQRMATVQKLAALHPELATDPSFARVLGIERDEPETATEPLGPAVSTARCVQHLAASYVPDAPLLGDATSAAAFLACVDSALRSFLHAKTQLDLISQPDTPIADHPEDAASRLARELLDWRGGAPLALARLERDLADLASRYARLVTDVRTVRDRSPAIQAQPRLRWSNIFYGSWLRTAFGRCRTVLSATPPVRFWARVGRGSAALGVQSLPPAPDAAVRMVGSKEGR